jgi:regulator of protease activity HflC (stomatin/prohibitin superfamily)
MNILTRMRGQAPLDNGAGRLGRSLRSRLPLFFGAALLLFFALSCFYTVDTGAVGVEKTLGRVDLEEIQPGLRFRIPGLTQYRILSAKEIAFDITDLTPKAADNLSLRDLDVSVFYTAAPDRIAELTVKYAAADEQAPEGWFPAFGVVFREARGAIYDEVARVDSLVLHRQREQLQSNIQLRLQARLDAHDEGVFTISRVVVRALNTDPSIEQAIQLAVQNQKRLEAKKIEVEIAVKDAEIEIARARGIAESNRIINSSLTAEYLQHEINKALGEFARNGGSAVVIPANMQGFQLLLDSGGLRRSPGRRTEPEGAAPRDNRTTAQ